MYHPPSTNRLEEWFEVHNSSANPADVSRWKATQGVSFLFPTHFIVDTNLDGFDLNLRMVVDDGALLYLNGAPILANELRAVLPGYAAFASRNVDNATTEFFTVPAARLVQGTNVLAAEVHQVNSGSSDIVWGLVVDASRTYTNCAPGSVLNVALSEVLAANGTFTTAAEAPADFVEIFNSGTNTLSLAGLSLSNDSRFPGKWVFPVGATIAAGGYRVINGDSGQPQSATNTGFGLKQDGGAVYLFNAETSGGNLIDAIQYGLQSPGFSIGRAVAEVGIWNLTLPSPGAPNVVVGLGNSSTLRINEWIADPATGPDWCELYNQGNQPVALGGLYLTENLGDPRMSPVAPLSFIGSGPAAFVKFIADGNPGTGANHVSFSLNKSGEELGIFSPTRIILDGLRFGAQQTGISQGRFRDGARSFASFPATDSPGESNFLPLFTVVISEVLTHTDLPLEDAIELYNPSDSHVAIGGWFLRNSTRDVRRFQIPEGARIQARGYTVFYEGDFNRGPAAFTLNSARGDSVVLSPADALGSLTGYRAEVKFGASENGVSFGRIATSVGTDFGPLNGRTSGEDNPSTVEQFCKGAGLGNAAPRIGPMVISEIMYTWGTGGADRAEDEFLELQNISEISVPLYDPQHRTDTYSLRGAVDFPFPVGIDVPPGARVIVVGFPASEANWADAFRVKYGVPAEVPILGAWNGRLANDQESIELLKPDAVQLPPHPDAGLVPEVLVDRVQYRASAPSEMIPAIGEPRHQPPVAPTPRIRGTEMATAWMMPGNSPTSAISFGTAMATTTTTE